MDLQGERGGNYTVGNCEVLLASEQLYQSNTQTDTVARRLLRPSEGRRRFVVVTFNPVLARLC